MRLITRRFFLAFLSILPLAVDAKKPTWQQLLLHNPASQTDWKNLINQIIGPYNSVVNVGLACQRSSRVIDNSPWSERYINQLTNNVNTMENEEIKIFRDAYRTQMEHDFQEGRIIPVNGYILSLTEVEICRWVATTIDTN